MLCRVWTAFPGFTVSSVERGCPQNVYIRAVWLCTSRFKAIIVAVRLKWSQKTVRWDGDKKRRDVYLFAPWMSVLFTPSTTAGVSLVNQRFASLSQLLHTYRLTRAEAILRPIHQRDGRRSCAVDATWQIRFTRRPASADRTARRQFQATGQPVRRTQASDAVTPWLSRYEAKCVQRRCFQCGSVYAFRYQGNGATPCQYIDTTRKAIDCATTLPNAPRVFI